MSSSLTSCSLLRASAGALRRASHTKAAREVAGRCVSPREAVRPGGSVSLSSTSYRPLASDRLPDAGEITGNEVQANSGPIGASLSHGRIQTNSPRSFKRGLKKWPWPLMKWVPALLTSLCCLVRALARWRFANKTEGLPSAECETERDSGALCRRTRPKVWLALRSAPADARSGVEVAGIEPACCISSSRPSTCVGWSFCSIAARFTRRAHHAAIVALKGAGSRPGPVPFGSSP